VVLLVLTLTMTLIWLMYHGMGSMSEMALLPELHGPIVVNPCSVRYVPICL